MSTISQVHIQIEPSSACTRKCWFCHPAVPPERRSNPRYLTMERHRSLVNELATANWTGNLIYCGHGEPLLCPDIIEMVSSARDILPDAKTGLVTNGDPLTPAIAEGLVKARLTTLVLNRYADDAAWNRCVETVLGSSFDRQRIVVKDHLGDVGGYSSRLGAIRPASPELVRGQPCRWTVTNLFLAAEPEWLLCCHDMAHIETWPGELSVGELTRDKRFKAIRKALLEGNREICEACRKCDSVDNPSIVMSFNDWLQEQTRVPQKWLGSLA